MIFFSVIYFVLHQHEVTVWKTQCYIRTKYEQQ